MQKNTSQEIQEYLKNHRVSTVLELSRSLNRTKADIRYHLDILMRTGVVEALLPTRKSSRRGRPARQFRLCREALPDNYSEIIQFLLSASSSIEETLSHTADMLYKEITRDRKTGSMISKLNNLVQSLNDRNYQARWETHAEGPVIVFQNCPYQKLLEQFPQFCQMDHKIIDTVLNNKSVHQQSFLQEDSKNCRFLISHL